MEGEIITIETAQKLAEYDKLKKQYEKVLNDYCRLDAYNRTQQKELIDYLTSYIELLSNKPDLIEESEIDLLKEILSKFKEIIGENNE